MIQTSPPVVLPWEIKSKHETIFSVFLLILAFLFRRHPSIVYPEILYVFLVFLSFNLLYHFFLKQKVQASPLAFSPIFVNGILITWAVHYSGGASSYLWVMYLLPIFTACLLYDGWRVWMSTVYVLALYASIHDQSSWGFDTLDGLQFLGKAALLLFSTSVTARLAAAERREILSALRQRKIYEESLEKLKAGARTPPDEGGRISLFGLGIHDVNTALSIILGSTQLMSIQGRSGEGREDLARVESAVRLGKVLLQNIFLLGDNGARWPRQRTPLHPLIEEAISQCRGEIRAKRLSVGTAFSASRDEAVGNPRLLQQSFVNFLFAAVSATPVGGRIDVRTRLVEDGKALAWEAVIDDGSVGMEEEGRGRFFDPRDPSSRGKGVGMSLYIGRELLLRHGARVEVLPREKQGNRILIRLPLSDGEDAPIDLKGMN